MNSFKGELGFHVPMHVWRERSLPEIIDIAKTAEESLSDFGLRQIWVNDNFENRNPFVTLGALAIAVPNLRLGTAIIHPFARNPIDLADAFATLSELTNGNEISMGIAAGARIYNSEIADMLTPSEAVNVIMETVQIVKGLTEGDRISFDNYPYVQNYYHLKPGGSAELWFKPQAPIKSYGAMRHRHTGAKLRRVIGEFCDGVILDSIRNLNEDRITKELDEFDHLNKGQPFKKIFKLNSSLSDNPEEAKQFAKRIVSHMATRESQLTAAGISMQKVAPLIEGFKLHRPEVHDLAPDEIVEKFIIAGTPRQWIEKIAQLFEYAEKYSFDQVLIGVPVGPDQKKAIKLWATEILPNL